MPLIRNVLKPLSEGVLIPLGLEAAAADVAIHKKMFGSGCPFGLASRTSALIIPNEEMNERIKSLEDSVLSIKGVSETIKNDAKGQKGRFLSMLLDTLGASLLGNLIIDQQ